MREQKRTSIPKTVAILVFLLIVVSVIVGVLTQNIRERGGSPVHVAASDRPVSMPCVGSVLPPPLADPQAPAPALLASS